MLKICDAIINITLSYKVTFNFDISWLTISQAKKPSTFAEKVMSFNSYEYNTEVLNKTWSME